MDTLLLTEPAPNILVTPASGSVFCRPRFSLEHLVLSVAGQVLVWLLLSRNKKMFGGNYVLAWISVLTSPRSLQLDLWLAVVALMDLGPLMVGLIGAMISKQDPEEATQAMRWISRSPAFRLNHRIARWASGCLFSHIYVLFMITVLITQTHRLTVKWLYCQTLS